MKIPHLKAVRPALSFLVLSLFFSCSKDTDLLAEYVIADSEELALRSTLLISDTYSITNGNPVVLDVLNNDLFNEGDIVKIVETTQPSNGQVAINENNTLTYTPNPDNGEESGTSSDTFNYTVEVEANGESDTQEGKVIVSIDHDYGELKAFPTAEGFGKYATGGRGGRIIEVTNLNDSGPGSLRAALEAEGRRTVVFKVGGIIQCSSYLTIGNGNGNVTIAGQTAPGDGITIKGAELRIQASNVIVRYLKIRLGSSTSGTNEDGIRIIAFNGTRTSDVIIDHCSVSWARDENIDIGGVGDGSSVENVTIQNSIISENIGTQYGLLLWNRATNISITKNLFAHNKERNIRSSYCTSSFEMINNVIYGYLRGTSTTYENQFDVVGNVYKSSQSVSPEQNGVNLTASLNNCPNGEINLTRAYLNDNVFNGNPVDIGSALQPYLKNSAVMSSNGEVLPSSEVEELIIKKVGANIPSRDAVDLRLIQDLQTREGNLIKDISSVGGYPSAASGQAYEDSDKDGISDEWEIAVGLNPSDSSDANLDENGDGYTNIEAFLEYLTQI